MQWWSRTRSVRATAEDSSAVQAGTYSELVNTVLFFVSQGTEKGLIQLTDDYDGDVEEDLNRACLEVAKDDPLGAYAVDFIKNDCTKVLTTYEATITISYRRTREQIRSLVNVTGTSAIRDEVRAALADFQSEVALRVGYFTESADSIAALVRPGLLRRARRRPGHAGVYRLPLPRLRRAAAHCGDHAHLSRGHPDAASKER